MRRQLLFDNTAQTCCSVSTATRHARIGLFRHRLDGTQEALVMAPAQDAHVLIVQLKDHPSHDLWTNGKYTLVPPITRGTVGILDLRGDTQAILRSETDSLHVHLPRTALDDIAADAGAPPISDLATGAGWRSDDPVAQQLAALLVPVMEEPGHATQTYLDHVVLAMTSHIAATYGAMRPRTIRPGSLAPWQLKRAQEILASDVTGSFSLQDVADACGLSVSYFSRAFKASTGTTPHAWLQLRRVERARTLLLDSSRPLSDIALQCGFSDQSHLTRVFRHSTGLTPGAWRRIKREA